MAVLVRQKKPLRARLDADARRDLGAAVEALVGGHLSRGGLDEVDPMENPRRTLNVGMGKNDRFTLALDRFFFEQEPHPPVGAVKPAVAGGAEGQLHVGQARFEVALRRRPQAQDGAGPRLAIGAEEALHGRRGRRQRGHRRRLAFQVNVGHRLDEGGRVRVGAVAQDNDAELELGIVRVGVAVAGVAAVVHELPEPAMLADADAAAVLDRGAVVEPTGRREQADELR